VHGILEGVKAAKPGDVASDTFSIDAAPSLAGTLRAGTFPFNLILVTATIPSSLNTHLLKNFPNLIRLTSPKLHRLPSKLHSELVDTKGLGNPLAAIHKKLLEIFANQTRRAQLPNRGGTDSTTEVGRVIMFCNQSTKAEEIGQYLRKMKVPVLVMTGSSEGRRRGSNKHLESFLRRPPGSRDPSPLWRSSSSKSEPRVLVTTSLLARGLDFSPFVSHVLIVDEPRNEVDFLHRAGRTGRAGHPGTVVIFGKGIVPRKAKKRGFA
jgi:ATP-dependent RNA helicase MRH4